MKASLTVSLQVCIYLSLSARGTTNLFAADAAGAVPSKVTSANVDHEINGSKLTRNEVDILERAQAANDDVYSSLRSVRCNEKMSRFQATIDGKSAQALDTVTAKLSFERGTEQYTDVHQNNSPRPSLSSIPGAWSEGEFGTLLLQTQRFLSTQKLSLQSFADLGGEQTAVYQFDVAAADSHWDLTVSGSTHHIPFQTRVWISVTTAEILKIDRVSLSIPDEANVLELRWGITLDRVTLNGKPWLLPSKGSYAVIYNKSQQWNLISFTDFQR